MSNQIQWVNGLSTNASLEKAIDEVVTKIKSKLTTNPDIGIVFISSAFASDYPRLMPILLEKLPLPCVIGCGGGGIVGMKNDYQPKEVEGYPALSLTVASLPDVEINPFYVTSQDLPDLDSAPNEWWQMIGVSMEKQPNFILLSDSFSTKINELLEGLDFAYPNTIKLGGLASASTMGVGSGLFYFDGEDSDEYFFSQGTVGVALSGNIKVDSIVAQGCRPIGDIFQVTQGERNIIVEMTDNAGNTDNPLKLLRQLIAQLSPEDQELAQYALFIGIVGDEFKLQLKPGDFLIRNLVGVDPKYGAIAVGDKIRTGQRVRFHLRDAKASADDLETLLTNYCNEKSDTASSVGALMFSCMGRGEGLYGKPNFDSQLFLDYVTDIPVAGFFCNGEIGQVGGTTFLHGYTSVFGIFSQVS
ncbi:FIST signal transduction protein [Geminocystis herdmanii]|uniref:FIST signal transduction protein n=1 Tax=Geminocystis herdmanii TaxID=669359 RepID=UPI0003449609|nr:FIST N-terminal domain-containing protein [Geminocystis herdmanii]